MTIEVLTTKQSGVYGLLLKKPNSKISEHLSFDE
jgi:hypothetical protein